MDHELLHRRAREQGANRFVYWLVRGVLQPFFLVYFRMARMGREHIPAKGPVIIAATMLAQLPLSLWWTRHFWRDGEFTTRAGPSLWVPNYLSAAVVLIGMPAATIFGGLRGADEVPVGPPVR